MNARTEDAVVPATDLANRVEAPSGRLPGAFRYLRHDAVSGFLVFLIALPLCLGIASACGYPPIAGIFTAVLGGILTPFLSNSELTIKGPAAGLIVIALGCITDFGGTGGAWAASDANVNAYRLALGIGVAAGAIQILCALLRSGTLGEFFPTAAVHGMLAAIGVIIVAKQLPIVLGVENRGEPLELLLSLPEKFRRMNPEIALIGFLSLVILFGLPLLKNKYLRSIPAPMVVVLVAIPLGSYFHLAEEHSYSLSGHDYRLGEEYLVPVPNNLFGALTAPDFSGLLTLKGWKWVLMFAVVGMLESLLSAKAIDALDPWRRKTNLDRDLLAVGVGNTLSAAVGGLPMISEIVRSKANIDCGARTRFANLWHGLFLFVFVATLPWLLHRIPLSALAAMLVYTGIRLASPREFAHVYSIGREQSIVFATTLVAVLATDLLSGILLGIAVKFVLHIFNGLPLSAMFRPHVLIDQPDERTFRVSVYHFAIFTNWLFLRRLLLGIDAGKNVDLDLSGTRLVDHTVMHKLDELQREFAEQGRQLTLTGLENHLPASDHPHASRRKTTG